MLSTPVNVNDFCCYIQNKSKFQNSTHPSSSVEACSTKHLCIPVYEAVSPVSPAPPVHALHAEPSGNISGCHLLIPAALLHGVATCCVCAGSLAA